MPRDLAARGEKIGPGAIPWIRVARSLGGARLRRINCNTWLKVN